MTDDYRRPMTERAALWEALEDERKARRRLEVRLFRLEQFALVALILAGVALAAALLA